MAVCQFAVTRVTAESTALEHPLPVHKRLGRPRFWKVLGGRGVGTKACRRWAQALAPQLQWWGSCQATCSARTPRSNSGLKEPCHGGSLVLPVGTWSPSKRVPHADSAPQACARRAFHFGWSSGRSQMSHPKFTKRLFSVLLQEALCTSLRVERAVSSFCRHLGPLSQALF